MSKKQITYIGNFDRIKNEDDLKLKPGQNINPPLAMAGVIVVEDTLVNSSRLVGLETR